MIYCHRQSLSHLTGEWVSCFALQSCIVLKRVRNWKVLSLNTEKVTKIHEFSSKDFHWIQWIKIKPKKYYGYQRHSLSDNTYIPRCSGKKIFPLYLGWYLFTVVSHNGYLPRGSNGNVFIKCTEFSEIHLGKLTYQYLLEINDVCG